MPNTDEPLSVVEDLEPEPPRSGSRQAWELVVGLVVLVCVLGFAGWQWLRQSQLEGEYAAGTQAAQRHDWDAARAHFGAASGYLDADRQAQAVATTIAQRDKLYEDALAYWNAANWAACLSTIQQVEQIEPNYKDSAQIEKQATNQIYSDALSGTVALRTQATPPGLYYYSATTGTESGWVWLPHSDVLSRVQGTGTGDWLVYDVPAGPPGSETTPLPPDSFSGSPQLRGRSLMAAPKRDPSHPVALSVDAYRYERFEWGRDGVWAIGFTQSAPSALYQSYGSPVTRTVDLASSRHDSIVVDFDPNSDRYLVETWTGADGSGRATPNTTTSLYVGTAGGDRKLLYTITGGGFNSAQFSPDGRRALLNTYAPSGPGAEKLNLVLLSVDGRFQPQSIAEAAASADDSAANQTTSDTGSPHPYYFSLSSAFVTAGLYAGDIVVAERASDHYNLRLIDAERAGISLMLTEVPTRYALIWSIFAGRDGSVVLVAREDYFGTDLTRIYTIPLIFVDLSPNAPPKMTRLLVDWDFYHTAFNYATIAGGQLFFGTSVCCDNEISSSLFAFPVDNFGAQRVRPSTISTETRQGAADFVNGTDQSFGPAFFGTISAGDLHVRSYDGSLDLTVDRQVTYLADPSLHRPGDDRLH